MKKPEESDLLTKEHLNRMESALEIISITDDTIKGQRIKELILPLFSQIRVQQLIIKAQRQELNEKA